MKSTFGLSRRTFLRGTAAAAGATLSAPLLASLGGTAWAAPEISSIRITQAVSSLAFIQNYVASELGYFAEEGLEVEIIVTRGGGPDVQAVLAGDAAFTVNDGAQVLPAVSKGQNLTCLLATLERNIINVSMLKETAERLGVGPDTPIAEKLASLKGLKIGITRPGSLTWQLARFNLSKAGLDPENDATVVGLGDGPAVAAALENGGVDVIYISVPVGERVVQAGKAITLIDNASGEDPNLPFFMMEGLWATPDFIAANPNTCQATVNALSKASSFILDNDASAVKDVLMSTFGSFGEEVVEIGVGKVKAAISTDGRFTQEMLDHTQDVLLLNESITDRFSIDQIFNDQFIG